MVNYAVIYKSKTYVFKELDTHVRKKHKETVI